MITELDLKPAVHDRVLVEAELDGQSISFRAVAVNVMPTAIWLGLVLPQPQLEQLKRDQPLQRPCHAPRALSSRTASLSFASGSVTAAGRAA